MKRANDILHAILLSTAIAMILLPGSNWPEVAQIIACFLLYAFVKASEVFLSRRYEKEKERVDRLESEMKAILQAQGFSNLR